MPDRPKHYDKEVYERAYKQSFQSLDRSRASSRPASAGAVGGVSTGTSAAQQKPAPRKEIDPRRVDPRTAVLDRQLINPGGIDSYPAALATVPHVKDSRPQNALHPTHKKKGRNSSPAKTEAWMDIFEKDDDLEVRTMRSMVPTPSPYFIPTPSPNAMPSATVPRDKLPHSSHRQDVTRLPGDRTRNLRTLDDRYAGKQRVRSSSDAPRPPKPSPAYYTPVHLIPPGERESRTNNLRHTAQSSRDLRTSHPAPRSHREGRSRHTRSSSDQPKLTRDPPRDPPLTSLVHEVRDRHLSDMRAGSAGMPLHPSRQRAALPGQWTVDAKPPAPATNGRYDMRQAGVAKPHIYQEKAVPHTPNILLPLTVAEQAEHSSRPRRHHGPPPSREAHGERHRPSSFDGGQHVDTRRKDRDRHLPTAVERPPERSDASRPTRAHEDEYRHARDKETRRQERRARRHTIDDDKSNLWLRESTFDPARLPPGNAPLPASYLPPKRPSRQSSRDSTRQQSHSRTMKESQQVPLSYPAQLGAHGYGPASGPSSHRAVPAQRHHAAPLHAPQPTAALAQPHLHLHGPPQVFAGESRWREDFDAKTLSASIFSADTPRAQSAPPEDVTPAKGLGRKLRKRPPEQPSLSIDATLRPPPGPVSPTLQSPASGGSDKARFGSLPRVFMPHKWLGSKT